MLLWRGSEEVVSGVRIIGSVLLRHGRSIDVDPVWAMTGSDGARKYCSESELAPWGTVTCGAKRRATAS